MAVPLLCSNNDSFPETTLPPPLHVVGKGGVQPLQGFHFCKRHQRVICTFKDMCLLHGQDVWRVHIFDGMAKHKNSTQACTANVHYLLHLPHCVIWNGPLSAFSCFSYEDANGKLRKLFHGTQHVEMQIVAAASVTAKLPTLASRIPDNSRAASVYRKATNTCPLSMRSWESVSSSCYMIGAAKHQHVTGPMAVSLRAVVGAPVSSCNCFTRALIHGRVFQSKCHGRVQQRNSYTVVFKVGGVVSYGQIDSFAKVRQSCCQCPVTATCSCSSSMYLAVINRLSLTHDDMGANDGAVEVKLQHIVKAYPAVHGNLVAVPVEQVISKVVFMDIIPSYGVVYLSQFPNLVEKD